MFTLSGSMILFIKNICSQNSNKQNKLPISANVADINYIMTPGWYWIDPGVIANVPGNVWGTLEVVQGGNGGGVTQHYTSYPDGWMVSRIYANSSWSDWRYPDGEITNVRDRLRINNVGSMGFGLDNGNFYIEFYFNPSDIYRLYITGTNIKWLRFNGSSWIETWSK